MSLNPIDHEDLFEAPIIGGRTMPGSVKLSGHDREFKYDDKEGDGQSGASSEYKGRKLGGFLATVYLVKDDTQGLDEFAEWDDFQASVLEKSLAVDPPAALLIYHPDLLRNGYDCVSVQKIGGMTHDEKGGATVAVAFKEYAPPKTAGGSPKPKGGGQGGAAWEQGKAAPDPNAAAKAELDALVAEASKP